jgi:NDP-sugar pyrophosphorylase family protein
MKAMILAAGVGTRLKPLTNNTPKALLKIGNYTLLEIILRRLASAGIRDIVVNVHHLADQITDFLSINNNFGMEISISNEADELLDTGGAIKKASEYFAGEETILVHNIDILSNLNFLDLINYHKKSDALITLAVKDRPTTRSLIIDGASRLCGWEFPEKKLCILTRENRKGLKTTAFSGVYVFNSKLIHKFPDEQVFGFIPWILNLASSEKIMTWDQSPAFWYEAGRINSIETAALSLSFDLNNRDFLVENLR